MYGQENNQTVSATDPDQGSAISNTATSNTSIPQTRTTTPVVNAPVVNNLSVDDPDESTSTEDLLNIKQRALSQLKPLVQHLDLSPEEKFRTTMMMIQASDNPSMIKSAYEVAQNLSSDQQKAQALLDIVNEINYFTHLANNQQD